MPKKKKQTPPQPEEIIAWRRKRLENRRSIRAFFVKAIFIAAIGYGLFTQVFGFAMMMGEDMYPRIRDGDLILYYRINEDWAVTDVATFARDGVRYVGRIVARGGDTVEITREGRLLVNGNVQSEEIFYATTVELPEEEEEQAPGGTSGVWGATAGAVPGVVEEKPHYTCEVPEGSVYLLCDMRTNATDSRVYGPVALSELDGKVISILRRRGI